MADERCPVCKKPVEPERVEPWPRGYGPTPWHMGCYGTQPVEHYVGDNGDTKAEAIEAFRRAALTSQSGE